MSDIAEAVRQLAREMRDRYWLSNYESEWHMRRDWAARLYAIAARIEAAKGPGAKELEGAE